jgi:uncharacterized membrane protein
VLVYSAARRRDRAAGVQRPPGRLAGDAVAAAIGLVAWVAFARWGHLWLVGVSPMA